jgi:predicted secreted Zn-dependent protease
MKRGASLLFLLFFLIPMLSDTSQAGVSQHFDKSGRLVPDGKKAPAYRSKRARKYSVPEGVQLRPDVRYEFYPVFGKTFTEIVRSVGENGPFNRQTRKRQPSSYDWSMGWTYQISINTEFDDENEKIHCDILLHDISPAYDIRVTLPALTDDSALNPIEKELWKGYFQKIVAFEHGHVRVIKDDMREMILKRMGEITYLMLDAESTEDPEHAAEQFVRAETARIGSDIVRQIQQNLAIYDSGPGPGAEQASPEKEPAP